jgi:hypothetical protein
MPSSLAVRGVDFQGVTVNEHKPQEESKERNLHDPVSDKLVPLAPLDLAQIKSVDDLVRAMGNTSFTARQVGEGADVLETMARDRGCFVVMTLAGAMTVAKQGLIVTDLIDAGVVQAVISTGALMAHGLVEAAGRSHFRYDPRMDDTELYDAGYNRVYDTLGPETSLDFVTVGSTDPGGWDHNEPLCSYKLNRDIGKYLSETSRNAAFSSQLTRRVFRYSFRLSAIRKLAWTLPYTIAAVARTTFPPCATIRSKILSSTPRPCCSRTAWASLLSEAE